MQHIEPGLRTALSSTVCLLMQVVKTAPGVPLPRTLQLLQEALASAFGQPAFQQLLSLWPGLQVHMLPLSSSCHLRVRPAFAGCDRGVE
jgi:hypothetical protein